MRVIASLMVLATVAALAGCEGFLAALDPCYEMSGTQLAACQREQAATRAVQDHKYSTFSACDAQAKQYATTVVPAGGSAQCRSYGLQTYCDTSATTQQVVDPGRHAQLTDQCMAEAGYRRAPGYYGGSSLAAYNYAPIDVMSLRSRLGY